MTVTRTNPRAYRAVHAALLGALVAAYAAPSAAFEVDLFDTPIRIDNLFTVGGMWRTQDRDHRLIGKSTLYRLLNPGTNEGLCVSRDLPNGDRGDTGPNSARNMNNFHGDTCTTSGGTAGVPAQPNLDYVAAPGSFSPNGDNGNLNFEKYDIVQATAKLTSDISFSFHEFNVFVRPIYFFDANYSNDFIEDHPDVTLQPRETAFNPKGEDLIGSRFDVLDYNISKVFNVLDRDVSVKIGNQVLNWGESALLFLNSLNSINPANATRARIPGFDLKEAFQPQGMVVLSTDIIDNVSVESFYQYEWKPLVLDPVGSYFSVSDTLGAGGQYAMLSFGKAPEDPLNLYQPYRNDGAENSSTPNTADDDPIGLLGSFAGRTIYRNFDEEAKRRPDDGGQYGAALKFFLEDFNNGTELSFYAANYHSRLPVVSAIATDATCLDSAQGAASLPGNCGYTGPYVAATKEPVPVDSAQLVVEYPENIKLYGVSFNTTVGDFALSGEYAHRPNLPIQIHTVDLTYAALQPAFPAGDISVGPAGTIPGRRSAVPSFLTQYRGFTCTTNANCIQPGQYIRGYESLKVGQTGITVLRLIGGDNPIGASQMTILTEMGWTHVYGMPGLDEIQFQGAGADTHISNGGDGSIGINPRPVANNAFHEGLRQNPTAADPDAFGDANSFGYRIINLNRWDSALFGANFETLSIIQHDVKGTTPGIGGNFVEGRRQFAFGLRADYLSTYIAEIRYTWFTGAGAANSTIDRDNVFVTVGVQF